MLVCGLIDYSVHINYKTNNYKCTSGNGYQLVEMNIQVLVHIR